MARGSPVVRRGYARDPLANCHVRVECPGDFLALCQLGTPVVPFWHAFRAAEGVRAIGNIRARPLEDRGCLAPSSGTGSSGSARQQMTPRHGEVWLVDMGMPAKN